MKNNQGLQGHLKRTISLARMWCQMSYFGPGAGTLVHESNRRITTCNIVKRRQMELVDTMIRRRISRLCLQETRWLVEKSKRIGKYKLWYTRKIDKKNAG